MSQDCISTLHFFKAWRQNAEIEGLQIRTETENTVYIQVLLTFAFIMNGHTSKEDGKCKVLPVDFLMPLTLVTFLVGAFTLRLKETPRFAFS